jgi:hypothetical protein
MGDGELGALLSLIAELPEHKRDFILGFMASRNPEVAIEAVAFLVKSDP